MRSAPSSNARRSLARRALALATVFAATVALTGCASTPRLAHDAVVATVGDSIMKGHGLEAKQSWPVLLGVADDLRVSNLACDGAGFLTIGDKSDCNTTFTGLLKQAVALNPQLIIVQGSSNDLGQDDSELAARTTRDVAKMHQALPNARIIGLSTIWNDTTPPAQIATISDQVRAAVVAVGGTFVDIGQPLQGHKSWMQSDDVHPTAYGQVVLYQTIKRALHRLDIGL